MKTLIPSRATKAIDQQASGIQPGGYYVRIDDRSTFSETLYDANASALSMSTVYACVRVLAESVASLPLVLYRRLPGGGKDRAFEHPLYPTLHDQPNPDMTSFVWRELVMSHLATWGNHYSEKVYDYAGRLQLWPIRPDRMEVKYDADGRKAYTYLSPAGVRKEMKPGSVFHVAGLSSNGLVGLSPIALHMKTLRLATTAQDFGHNFLANNARPATVLSHPNNLSDGAISRLAGQMEQLRGSKNAGKTVVLEEGLTVTEVGVPPEQAQYIETRKFQRQTIASEIFRIPPHMIGDLESGASYASIEQMSLEFVMYVLMPWLARIEQECRAQLIYEDDVFPEFLVDGLLRGDAKSRAEAFQVMRINGVINGDEWRDRENLNPIPGGSGKVYWMPENYQSAATPETVAAEQAQLVDPENPPQLVAVKSSEVRCDRGHLLAELATPPYKFTCGKCKSVKSAALDDVPADPMKSIADRLDLLPDLIAAAMPTQSPQLPPEVHFHEGSFKAGDVHVPPIVIERGAVQVSVAAPPAAKPPVVNVNLPEQKPLRRTVERDANDKIIAFSDAS